MVNPEWSPQMEKELRAQFSEVAYEHEVLAEFGTEMVGVFNKDYIDEASSIGYEYTTSPSHPGPISIGVDWDIDKEAFKFADWLYKDSSISLDRKYKIYETYL